MSTPNNAPPDPLSVRSRRGDRLLLTFSQAAALLGVGRNASLHALIRTGLLRPVTLLGKARIPREQVEALARGGDALLTAQAPSTRRPKKVVKSIADIEIS